MSLLQRGVLARLWPEGQLSGLLRAATPDSAQLTTGETRPVLLFVAVTAVYVLVAAPVDAAGDISRQWLVAATTWLFVGAVLRRGLPHERVQVVAMIAVATGYECFGSLLWRAYEYRLGNLPLYVPPGHGLFYLVALRLSSMSFLRLRAPKVIAGVLAVSGLWALRGIFFASSPDILGLLAWFLLAYFLTRGRDPLFFAVSFIATMALEYYGTYLGTWRWADTVPVLGIPAANPPSAIGAGYCIIDATTQRCLPYVARLLNLRSGSGQAGPLQREEKSANK